MSERQAFCLNCHTRVTYIIMKKISKETIRGTTIHYIEKIALCPNCKEGLFIGEIHDENIAAIQNLYRQKNNLLPLDIVKRISTKYNIKRRPLSVLLGWGEHTFSRYCDGNYPSKQYSDILLNIYFNPSYFLDILENNREKLTHDSTYERSKNTTLELVKSKEHSLKRVINVQATIKMMEFVYLICKAYPGTNPHLLWIALYYINGFNYAFSERCMFVTDSNESLDRIYNNTVLYFIQKDKYQSLNSQEEIFSATELSVMKNVMQFFSCYSEQMLNKIISLEEPYQEVRRRNNAECFLEETINSEQYKHHFILIKDKHEISTPNDIEKYFFDLFKKLIDADDTDFLTICSVPQKKEIQQEKISKKKAMRPKKNVSLPNKRAKKSVVAV